MKKRATVVVLVTCVAGCFFLAGAASPGMDKARFSRTTIDIGVVVSDVEKATRFYRDALGFTETRGFEVSAQMSGDTGLTDYKPLKVRVFILADEPGATRLKVMEIPEARPKKVDNKYISSSLGLSYLTVFVSDMTAALARLAENSVAPVTKPYQLGSADNYLTLVKDPDGNTIELIGPMR